MHCHVLKLGQAIKIDAGLAGLHPLDEVVVEIVQPASTAELVRVGIPIPVSGTWSWDMGRGHVVTRRRPDTGAVRRELADAKPYVAGLRPGAAVVQRVSLERDSDEVQRLRFSLPVILLLNLQNRVAVRIGRQR